jgi:hypothetical protein
LKAVQLKRVTSSLILFVILVLLAVSCGGAPEKATEAASPAASSAASTDEQSDACSFLPKELVQSALHTGDLTDVSGSELECAYGTKDEEAQVTFSSGSSLGGLPSYQKDITRFRDTLGDDHVRVLTGVGQAAFVVDNGPGGGFFASALSEGNNQISIYIYPHITYKGSKPVPDIPNEDMYRASQEMLAAAVRSSDL